MNNLSRSKFLALLITLALVVTVFTGCNNGPKPVIIVTSFDVNGYRPWSPFCYSQVKQASKC